MTQIVFLDTEYTNLVPPHRPGGGRLWEIGMIVRTPSPEAEAGAPFGRDYEDREIRWLVDDVDLSTADPKSLEVGRFYERHPRYSEATRRAIAAADSNFDLSLSEYAVSWNVAQQIRPGCHIVGAVPGGDVDHLRDMLYRHGLPWVAHYHLIDIESMIVGYLWATGEPPALPWPYSDLLAGLGLVEDEKTKHTALGNARMVRAAWDVMTGGQA